MLDSALALARSPFFSLLDRVALAKLAGELEEVEFTSGELLFREGDPGGAFYVVRSGQAQVFVGANPAIDAKPILMGAGEVFGEMAMLGNTPRTASVRAYTDLAVWRLHAERFNALPDRDRSIARSVERALVQRLTARTYEADLAGRNARTLAEHALRSLTPGAQSLLHRLAALPRWNRAGLEAICSRTGDLAAFDELSRDGLFLTTEGMRVSVAPFFAALLTCIPWA